MCFNSLSFLLLPYNLIYRNESRAEMFIHSQQSYKSTLNTPSRSLLIKLITVCHDTSRLTNTSKQGDSLRVSKTDLTFDPV